MYCCEPCWRQKTADQCHWLRSDSWEQLFGHPCGWLQKALGQQHELLCCGTWESLLPHKENLPRLTDGPRGATEWAGREADSLCFQHKGSRTPRPLRIIA
jgi:hypothetical protein